MNEPPRRGAKEDLTHLQCQCDGVDEYEQRQQGDFKECHTKPSQDILQLEHSYACVTTQQLSLDPSHMHGS